MKKMKKEFIEFILAIITRPGMYNINRVEDLTLIMLGYVEGAANEDAKKAINDFLIDFRSFVNKEFNSLSDTDWARLIRFYSASDKHSIELFEQKFKDFIHIGTSV